MGRSRQRSATRRGRGINRLLDPPEIKLAVQRMACTACGAEANASCTCGVAYTPKSVRAAEAVKANPEKSDRAIAADLGVSHVTVGKARKAQLETQLPVDEPRTGLDGRRASCRQRGRPTLTSRRILSPKPTSIWQRSFRYCGRWRSRSD